MVSAREQAREAARATVPAWRRSHPEHGDVNWQPRCDQKADAASDVWEPYIQRILNVVNNDGIGYVKTIGMIVDICDEALDG